MSRRHRAIKRKVNIDPRFNSQEVSSFINVVMRDGKKSVASRVVYGALEMALQKTKMVGRGSGKDKGDGEGFTIESPADVLAVALARVRPTVEVKPRRVGGATYQVPVEVPVSRGVAIAMRWIISAAKVRSEKGMLKRLASELMDAIQGKGGAMKKLEEMVKRVKANQAFAHFR